MTIIHGTEKILRDLDNHIKEGKPFATTRFGDVGYGVVAYYKCPEVIPHCKKWNHGGIQRDILNMLGVPKKKIRPIVDRIVENANISNYIDSPAAYSYELAENNVPNSIGNLAAAWKKIHEAAGVTNTSYCSALVHYFTNVEGEYNLFDVMQGRSVFCIGPNAHMLPRIQEESGAQVIDNYQIPKRGKKGVHYRDHYHNIMDIIKEKSSQYDLFLIGAGLLARVYCGEVKRNGGRVFDSGRLFDFWAGKRDVRGRSQWFLKRHPKKLLFERISGHGNKIW